MEMIKKSLNPPFFPWEVYQYSDQMVKHLPTDALKQYKKHYCSVENLFISPKLPMSDENTIQKI